MSWDMIFLLRSFRKYLLVPRYFHKHLWRLVFHAGYGSVTPVGGSLKFHAVPPCMDLEGFPLFLWMETSQSRLLLQALFLRIFWIGSIPTKLDLQLEQGNVGILLIRLPQQTTLRSSRQVTASLNSRRCSCCWAPWVDCVCVHSWLDGWNIQLRRKTSVPIARWWQRRWIKGKTWGSGTLSWAVGSQMS